MRHQSTSLSVNPSAAGVTLRGVDVSNHQGAIDWHAVATSGIRFAGAKASEGIAFSDSFFPANWRGMKDNSILRLAYHFARADVNDPEPEAQHFLDCLDAAGGVSRDDVVALDMEVSVKARNLHHLLKVAPNTVELQPYVRRQVRLNNFAPMLAPPSTGPFTAVTNSLKSLINLSDLEWATAFLDYVKAALHFEPMFYSGLWFMQPNGLLNSPRLSNCGLWYGNWSQTMPLPPPDWDFIAIWQNSDTGTVPGVNGLVDTDLFNGDEMHWSLYGPQGRKITNDEWTYAQRVMLDNNTLNPQKTAAYLSQFDDD